jgi:hypothetical protein
MHSVGFNIFCIYLVIYFSYSLDWKDRENDDGVLKINYVFKIDFISTVAIAYLIIYSLKKV